MGRDDDDRRPGVGDPDAIEFWSTIFTMAHYVCGIGRHHIDRVLPDPILVMDNAVAVRRMGRTTCKQAWAAPLQVHGVSASSTKRCRSARHFD